MQHCYERASIVTDKELLRHALRYGMGDVSVEQTKRQLLRDEFIKDTKDGPQLAVTSFTSSLSAERMNWRANSLKLFKNVNDIAVGNSDRNTLLSKLRRSRLAAHAAHLAVVEREAIEAVARGKAAEWASREQKLRETEWEMHEAAIAAAKRGLLAYMEREKVYANLADIARMLEIASKLGRLATGLGDADGRDADDLPALRVEVTLALEKIYGQAEPAPNLPPTGTQPAIVDVEEAKR